MDFIQRKPHPLTRTLCSCRFIPIESKQSTMFSSILVSALAIAASAAGVDARMETTTAIEKIGAVSDEVPHSVLHVADEDLDQHDFGRQLTGWNKWAMRRRQYRNRRRGGKRVYTRTTTSTSGGKTPMGKAPMTEEEKMMTEEEKMMAEEEKAIAKEEDQMNQEEKVC